MFHGFLSTADADRALRSLGRLVRHDIRRWALTGGFAIEIHHMLRGHQPSLRPLNDVDFIADSFDCVVVKVSPLGALSTSCAICPAVAFVPTRIARNVICPSRTIVAA